MATGIKKTNIFYLLNSLIGALFIYFLVSTFLFRIFFSVSFFFFSYFFQVLLFNNAESKTKQTRIFGLISKNNTLLILIVAAVASLIILLIPSYDFPIYSEGIYKSFISLSPVLILRVIFGYFIVTFFPGKILFDAFLRDRYSFNAFEKFGFSTVVSYVISTVVGLALLQFTGSINPIFFLFLIWLVLLPAIAYMYVRRHFFRRDNSSDAYSTINYSKLGIVLSLVAVLLFSSYMIHMFSQPMTGIYSGDVNDYFDMANQYVNLGSMHASYLWFQVYLKISSIMTGLPLIYTFAGMQFLVLLPSIAFYMFIKTLFPKYSKTPEVTAGLILVQGLVALPTAIMAMISPQLYNQYISGNTLSLLNGYVIGIGSQTATWISVFANLLEISIAALAFVFLYRYLRTKNYREKIVDMFLGVLFLNVTLFTHGIFLFSILFFSIVLFLFLTNIENAGKKFLLLSLTLIGLFLIFDFLDGWFFLLVGNHTTSYFLMFFFPFLILLAGIMYLKEKVAGKVKFNFSTIGRKNFKLKAGNFLWPIALFLILISLAFGVHEWGSPLIYARYANFPYFFPWYVYLLSFGLPLIIIIGGFSFLQEYEDKKPIVFISCWLLSLIFFGLFSPFLLGLVFPFIQPTEGIIFNRFFLFAIYLTSCLAALILVRYTQPNRINLIKRITITSKIIPLILTVALAFSFLFIPFGTQFLYSQGSAANYNSNLDAAALSWINSNTSADNTIISLSYPNYLRLISDTRLKVIPPPNFDHISSEATTEGLMINYFSGYSGSYIYVQPKDFSELSDKTAAIMLPIISSFPISYKNDEITIYLIPSDYQIP
jgi:hypothetical protein